MAKPTEGMPDLPVCSKCHRPIGDVQIIHVGASGQPVPDQVTRLYELDGELLCGNDYNSYCIYNQYHAGESPGFVRWEWNAGEPIRCIGDGERIAKLEAENARLREEIARLNEKRD